MSGLCINIQLLTTFADRRHMHIYTLTILSPRGEGQTPVIYLCSFSHPDTSSYEAFFNVCAEASFKQQRMRRSSNTSSHAWHWELSPFDVVPLTSTLSTGPYTQYESKPYILISMLLAMLE